MPARQPLPGSSTATPLARHTGGCCAASRTATPPSSTRPSRAIGSGAGYDQDDLARDLGLQPGDPALQSAAPTQADAFAGSFWTEAERAAASTAS